MDGTEADGEWSDEEVLQSGSQTGLSETEQEDGQREHTVQMMRPETPFRGTLSNVRWVSTSPSATITRTPDPVSAIMDKIDAELQAIESEESKTTWPGRLNNSSRHDEPSQAHSQTRLTEVSFANVGSSRHSKAPGTSENTPSRKSINSLLLPDKKDTYTGSLVPDTPSDLDPITAREIDARFKEIMSKKKGLSQTDQIKESVLDSHPPRRSRRPNQSATTPSRLVTIRESQVDSNEQGQGRELEFLLSRLRTKNACRPSAVMLSAGGYATDNESVKTEDFESKFLSLMVSPTEADRLQQTSAKSLDTNPAGRPAPGASSQSGVKLQQSRPRSCSPVRMGLQRYRTTDNAKGFWDSKLGSNKKGSQVFSWDDEFWKQSSRRGPQSVASSFEEVESLCLSKSSSDSMGSTQRQWERLGHGQDPGAWGPKRRFISRQSSTTSTSTSRSSGLVGDHVSTDANVDTAHQNASIKDTLLESMELLGAHGNLDLAEKIYLEKIFHRVLDWNNGMPVSSSSSSKALDKHFWGPMQQSQPSSKLREQQRDTGSPQLHATLRERLEKLNQREQPSSKLVLQLPNPAEKKRIRDLIVPDDEEPTGSSFKQPKPSVKLDSASTTSSSKDTSRASKESSLGDSSSRYSYISSMSSASMDNGSMRGSPQGSTVPPSLQSPSLATFLPPTFRLSGSFESTASPPDTYMFNQPYTPSHAERVLMGLGFGATEGFLPERFLRDWYSKIAKAQMEAQLSAQAEIKTPDIAENSPTFPVTTPATPDIDIKTTERRDSHVSIASSMLDEAANFFPLNISQDAKNQRLKEYIAAYSNHSNSPTEARDFTLRHFAPTRQKSLPLFLETLSEEEEGRSRISGVDPFDKEARLQMFISDAMSSSGKSTGSNSENSYISSNQSESDSVSSSEQHSSQHRKNQHIKAYNKHLAEERKMENERKENEARAQNKPDDDDERETADRRHRPRPKGSPKRQSTVKRNENFDKATSYVDHSGITNLISPSLPLEETPNLYVSSEKQSMTNNSVTSEKQNSIHSKDSIEVEEIILYQPVKSKSCIPTENSTEMAKHIKAVEPAMVSIVLEDVDRDASCSDNMLPISYLGLPASRCSSSSLSPIPQSPVTVIEVSLDNQQDSLDTEGTGSSRETDDDNFPQQTSSSEDAARRPMIRSKSRCSKSYKTPGLGETPRRRNSSASPLPLSLSRLSPSGEFDQAKPRRRLSLEVPITPEVRYMLERQRAYSIGQLSDDAQLSRIRDAESNPNSGTNEKLGRDISEENTTNSQEKRPNSPRSKSESRQYAFRGNCEVILDTNVDSQNEGMKRMSTQHSGTCQCYITSRANKLPKESAANENSACRSTESSPGSGRSAFRIATKGKRDSSTLNGNGYMEAGGTTNLDDLPRNLSSIYRPQVIGSMHPLKVDYLSTFREENRHTDGASPPVNFSDTRPLITNLRAVSGSGNKVHCISRAVQVNESLLFPRPLPHHHSPSEGDYFYACDRSTQCSLFDDAARDLWSCQLGVSIFNKGTQTGVPTYEISCQTQDTIYQELFGSAPSSHFTNDSVKNVHSKAVNTVMSLIGREHENDHHSVGLLTDAFPARHDTDTDFRFVDETLEQIEKELNFINKKECVNYLSFIAKADQFNSIEKTALTREPSVSFVALSNIYKSNNMCLRSKSLNSDESVISRIAPTSWHDVTNIDPDSVMSAKSTLKDLEILQSSEDIRQSSASLITDDIANISFYSIDRQADCEKVQRYNVHENKISTASTFDHLSSNTINAVPQCETDLRTTVGGAPYHLQSNINTREHTIHSNVSNEIYPLSEGDNITPHVEPIEDNSAQDWVGTNEEELDKMENEQGLTSCSTEGKVNNTTANECQEKVTQWRRFSLPTMGYQKTALRSHSKLSRLRYQTNSQSSYNSLDLELDFMSASYPIAKLSTETMNPFQRQKRIKAPSNKSTKLRLDDLMILPTEEIESKDGKSFFNPSCTQKLDEVISPVSSIKKPASPKLIAMRDGISPGQSPDVDSGTSTPEIFISPLKTFQMDFLRIPGTPKDYVTKAIYPSSSSSGSTSPYKESGLTTNLINAGTVDNVGAQDNEEEGSRLDLTLSLDVPENLSISTSLSGLEYFQHVENMKSSMSDSDLPASTVDSTVDVSVKSSIEQSADELSDTSMMPRLSLDSLMEEIKQQKQPDELSIDPEKVHFLEATKALEVVDAASLHFYTGSMKLQRDPGKSTSNESGSPESFDFDEVSNISVAGSDTASLADLDFDIESNFKTRSSSASSYSEPMLDNIGSLSQDSLSSEDAQLLMNYLRIGERMDDLLQVSDYGGASPSPTKMIRRSMDDSSNNILDSVFLDSAKRPKALENETSMMSSEAQNELEFSDDNWEIEISPQNENNCASVKSSTKQILKDHILIRNSRETGSKDFIQSTNDQNNEKQMEDRPVDESSGDECDKEILSINLNRPIRKRLIRMSSDPVDKDIFCRSKPLQKQTSAPKASFSNDEEDNKDTIEDCVRLAECKLTFDQPSSSEMMAVFQNVDLSYLQSCLDFSSSQAAPISERNETDNLLTDSNFCTSACVLSVEFSNDDSMEASDINEEGGGNLDSMMALFDTIEDYSNQLDYLKDELILSPSRHFPLPQISEEGTVSEDTSDGGGLSHTKPWFYGKYSEDSDCLEHTGVKKSENDLVPKEGVSLQEDYEFTDQTCDNTEDATNITISVSSTEAPRMESCENDDVFEDDRSNGQQILNSIFSRQMDNQDVLGVNIRAVSPSSKVFDFAQSLVESTIRCATPARTLEQCQGSSDWTSSEFYNGDDETVNSNNTSLDSHLYSGPLNPQITDIHTVEKKIDLSGTLVTKFASTQIVRFNYLNAIHMNSNKAHEKHISTASVMIGDYRDTKLSSSKHHELLSNAEHLDDTDVDSGAIEKACIETCNSNLSYGINSNSKPDIEVNATDKKKQLQNKLRAFLLLDKPLRQDSKILDDEQELKTQGIAGMEGNEVSSSNGVGICNMDEENFDLKSRVKAMFLIDDRNFSENATLEGRHVKVTTLFSRNSKEARTSFSSTSISDLDDSVLGTETEPVKPSSLSVVRTLNTSDAPSSAGAKKKPRKLRTRDSLLKLHEQTNVSSSIGSDTDSELISALRNQGDYDVRERDLALGLLTADAIDEDDHPVSYTDEPNIIHLPEPKAYINTVESGEVSYNSSQSSPCQEILPYNETLNLDRVTRGFSPPKVIIQQPSEDNTHEHLKRLNLPLLNLSGTASLEQGGASPPIDLTDSKHMLLSKQGSSSTWLRRTPRMQLLSPNAALTKKQCYDDLQHKDYTSRATDDSHPELDYLDIIPKLSQQQRDEFRASPQLQLRVKRVSLPRLLLHEPEDELGIDNETDSPRHSMRSPEPKPLIDFVDDDDDPEMQSRHDIEIGLPLFYTSAEDEYGFKCQRWSENANDSDIVGAIDFYAYDTNEVIESSSANGQQATNDIDMVMSFNINKEQPHCTLFSYATPIEKDSFDCLSCIANEGIRDLYHNSMCQNPTDYSRHNSTVTLLPLHLEIAGADTTDRNMTCDGAIESVGNSAIAVRAGGTQHFCAPVSNLYQEPTLMVESGPDSGRYTEALTPWSNVIDNVALPGDILDPESQQYKKLLSVTSHDSGFDSQGSPIELTTLKTADWSLAPFRVVQEEAQNEVEGKRTVSAQPGAGTYQSRSPVVSLDKQPDRRARSVSPTYKHKDIFSSQRATPGNTPPPAHSYIINNDRAANISSPMTSNPCQTNENMKQLEQTEANDLKSMRHALTKTRHDLTEIEHTLLDTRELSEGARSGLMMLEYQRENVSKDLEKLNKDVERLNADVNRKQEQLAALDSELQVKLEDLKAMASMSVTKQECLEVKTLKDDNWNLKNKLRSLESLQAERDELVSQLDAANQELFRQQKHNRLQTVKVQEEMESLTSKVEEIQNGWAEDQDQLAKLQQAYRRMELEKNELIKGKAKEYEQMKAALRDEVTDVQQRMGKELVDLGNEVTELRLQVSHLSADNATKDSQLKNAREQMEALQSSTAVEKQERAKAANDYRTALNNLKREMSSAVSRMKDSMFLEKQKALEDLKKEIHQERSDLTASHENRLHQMMEHHSYQILEKDSVISNLQDVLRRQENQKQSENDLQVHDAIVRERALIEQEMEWQVRKEREDGNRRIKELMVQCEQERQTSRDLLSEIGILKKELEEQRRLQRDVSKEKLLAVAKAKELLKQQNQAEIERIKFNLNQEHEHEFDELRDQVRMKEDEATKLCLEKQAAIEREKQILQVLEQTERLVINEINDECQKVSRVLGITVHNLGMTNYKQESSESRHNITSRTTPVISSALAHLRDCNERLVNHVVELGDELDSVRIMLDNVMKEKDDAVENCTIEMERQKTLELETLKEKLLKDHVHEMSRVIQECADTNTQLRTNSEQAQRQGDAALLEALQAKDDELFSVEQTMAQWKSDLEEKFNTQLQLLMAKEREKYQALHHHTTREQSRINELQRKEIERLENEVEKLSLSQAKSCNIIHRSPSPASSISQISDSLSVPLSNPLSPGNLKSSQQYLQARIQQLQADNAALRKQRLLASRQLGSSTNSLRASSPKGQSRASLSRDPNELHWLADKFKQGEKEAIKVNEQAKLNQKILNNKMDEMARLQNTLISQNKELQELERAYNDLHKHYNSRPSSPITNLNVTI